MKDFTNKLQCHWIHPAIVRLYAERAAYERADRARVVVMIDIEAELAEVSRRFGRSR